MSDINSQFPVLTALVEGQLDPGQWDAWWSTHGTGLLALLTPGQALRFRIAAGENQTVLARIAACQEQAAAVLQSCGVSTIMSTTYRELARQELIKSVQAIQQQNRFAQAARKTEVSRLDGRFPDFAQFLRRRARELDDFGPSASKEDLEILRSAIGESIPRSLREFLLHTRSFRVGNLIDFDIEDMAPLDFSEIPESERPRAHGMVLLCNFWLEADGDQLVFDQHEVVGGECPIFYYSHESRPPRLTRVADTFDGLLAWWAKGPQAWNRTLDA